MLQRKSAPLAPLRTIAQNRLSLRWGPRSMDSLIARALDTATARGATYADARMVETAQERYSVRTGVVDVISSDESLGLGVRVVVDGAWGFASTNTITAEAVDQASALAVEIARASATSGGPRVELGSPVTSRGVYTTPVEVDPFTVAPEKKLALLLDVDERMGRVERISTRTGNLIFIRERKSFANSEGADVQQTIYEAGGGIQATAVGNGEVQRRSYRRPWAASRVAADGSTCATSTWPATPSGSPARPWPC